MKYESHITIEPVFEERLERAKEIGRRHQFKVASLLMQKWKDGEMMPSANDTFMTGHSSAFAMLRIRMMLAVKALRQDGFKVLRYKIERIVLDSRNGDALGLLEEAE